MNTLWTVQKILKWTIDFFEKKGLPDARLSAELLLAHVLKVRRLDLYLQFERILTTQERQVYKQLVQRRATREPLQYIIGKAEFYGMVFSVTPAVLIPRPETELLVDAVIEHFRQSSVEHPYIVDVGTGSGCMAIAIKYHLPQATVVGVDISEQALAVARENAQHHGVAIDWVMADGVQFLMEQQHRWDAIVSNPPYISSMEWPTLDPEVREFEPRQALVAGKSGLEFYQRLIPVAHQRLRPGGILAMEMGYAQGDALQQLLETQGFQYKFVKDYQQHNRMVIGYHEQRKQEDY